MVCTVCDQQRADLVPRKSKLIPSMNFLLCAECIKAKREPRFAIILAGRANGFSFVSEYLRLHRYVGDEIVGKELA